MSRLGRARPNRPIVVRNPQPGFAPHSVQPIVLLAQGRSHLNRIVISNQAGGLAPPPDLTPPTITVTPVAFGVTVIGAPKAAGTTVRIVTRQPSRRYRPAHHVWLYGPVSSLPPAAALVLTPPTVTVTPNAVGRVTGPSVVAFIPPSITLTPAAFGLTGSAGAIALALIPPSITVTPAAFGLTKGVTLLAFAPATIAVTGQPFSPSLGSAAATIVLTPTVITLTASTLAAESLVASVVVAIPAEMFLSSGSPVVAVGFLWEILRDGAALELAVGNRPTISWDQSRPVQRIADRLAIPSRQLAERDDPRLYADDVNVYRDRVRASMLIPGANYVKRLGLFRFSQPHQKPRSQGTSIEAPLDDFNQVLVRSLPFPIGIAPGDNVAAKIAGWLDQLGIFDRQLEASTVVCTEEVAFAQGTDTWQTALVRAHAMCGWLRPHFNGDGRYIGRSIPDIDTATPDITIGTDEQLVWDTLDVTTDLLTSANQYQVTDTGAKTPVVGIYNIPDSAPGSRVSRGDSQPIVRSISRPGAGDKATADMMAKAEYVADPRKHVRATFLSPKRPHDAFWIVNLGGVNMLELTWSLPTAPGPMAHSLAGTFAP